MAVSELRPPPALPTGNIREFSRWCKQALGGALTSEDELNAAVAALAAAYAAADAAHVAASDPHPQYTTAGELAAATAGLLASSQFTAFAVGTATPAGTQAANADTSGATLGALETEVNQIKAVLRTFGLIAP